MMRPGGTGPAREATEDVQQVCNQVKDQAEKFLEKSFGQFQALSYRPQTVAGVNYFVKVCAY
jgi:cystatin-A/B